MLGIILLAIGTLTQEIKGSMNKHILNSKKSDLNIIGINSGIGGIIIFSALIFYKDIDLKMYLNSSIFIYIGVLVALSFLLRFTIIKTDKHADRSAVGVIGVTSILIGVFYDYIIGLTVTKEALIGMAIIFFTILLFNITKSKTLNLKGAQWPLALAFVGPTEIFTLKYLIENHGASIEALKMIGHIGSLLVFAGIFIVKNKELPFKKMVEKQHLYPILFIPITGVAYSYAITVLNVGTYMAIKRSLTIIFSTVTGKIFFKEEKTIPKIIMAGFLIVGIAITAL